MEHARPPPELCLEGGPARRADAWRRWYTQFEVFLKASGVCKESDDVQASLLVNLIGSEGYDVYLTFKFTKDEKRDDLKTLVSKFNEHFGTKQNATMARFKFFSRNQENGESIDEYVTALKILAQPCEFNDLEESLIRDRIVCGVADSKVRDRLLRAEELTLEKAVKICQANEMSNEEKRQIEGTKTEGASSSAVDAVYGPRGRQASGPGGRPQRRRGRGGGARRGGSAPRDARPGPSAPALACIACAGIYCDGGYRCPAKNAKCLLCSGIGHFKARCPFKSQNKVYHIEKENHDGDDDDLYFIDGIHEGRDDSKDDKKWYETLCLCFNRKKVNFKLDTGSDLNVLSFNSFKGLGLDVSLIKQENVRAQSFCGNYIPIMGTCIINWLYKDRLFPLRFVISEHDCKSVLGKNACEDLGLIKRILSLDIDQYEDLFHGLGKLPGKYTIVIEEGSQPSVCPVRKIPLGVRDRLQGELDRMERMGVIRKISHPTPWVNAIVVAAKKDGSIRVCLDPRPLNRVVRRARYPLPALGEIATRLQGARYFSKLDARSGFWMVQIDDSSADLCTFGTPFGRYQFLRLPYGINCASEVFHSKVRQILEDLEGVESFVDDIICWGRTLAEHDARLKLLLDRARDVGIKFNKQKCEFRVEKVTYLGHTFSKEGMCIDKEKLKAIKMMPSPQDRPSLERFLGMVNYLSKFIPNYSEVASPLRCLLKKDTEWRWDTEHESACVRLKELVCGAPVLAIFAPRAPVLLSVDASAHALGAVLLQEGRPVEFASATLTDAQTRYAQIEKELLAIVFGLERFHQYVYAHGDVTIETDHKPLEALFSKPLDSVPARLQRMMLRTQGYDFKVVYKPGKYMFVADALSRAPLADKVSDKISVEVEEQSCFMIENIRFSSGKLRMIKEETAKDELCQLIIKRIQSGWPHNKYDLEEKVRSHWSFRECLEYVNGIIFKDNLVYIPTVLRSEMINRVHDGHMGIDRCKRHAREVMFWPGMSRDVERRVRRCAACAARAPRPPREPLLPHDIPDVPWMKVGSDIFQYGGKYFLLLVDYFSNFIEVCPIKNMGSRAVILAMKDQFARHGIPWELVTDNGPAYASKEFTDFKTEWDFDHTTTSPHYPRANGRSEKSVRTIKDILIKSINSGTDFYLGLLNFRTTPRDNVSSPSQLLMGRTLNTRLPVHENKLRPSRDNKRDYENMICKQENSKRNYDRRARALPELQPGDPVLVVDGRRRKSARVESRAEQPRSYWVTDRCGKRIRRNRWHLMKLEESSSADNSNAIDNAGSDEESWSSADSDSPLFPASDRPPSLASDRPPSPASKNCDDAGAATAPESSLQPDTHAPAEKTREPRPAAVKARMNLKNYV